MRPIAFAALAALVFTTPAWAEKITYRYDARGRLVAVERSEGVNNGVVTTHTYDKANNRTSKMTSGVAQLAPAMSQSSESVAVEEPSSPDAGEAPPLR
jgi:YD repeat-containing protein